MDSDVQEIINCFKKLNTNSTRHLAIHQIIDELTSHEWRDVKERINQRTFQKDILGALPLEIAVQIAQYLSLAELHLLRRVNTRWHDILGSKAACGHMYRQYTGNIQENLEFAAVFTHYSKQRTRLEHGDPHEDTLIEPPALADKEVYTLDYSDGRYAWTTDDSTTIVVHNLSTGVKQRFCTKNRERLYQIRLSQTTVAAVTVHGYCHVWSILTEETYSVRLANTDMTHFVLSGFRVAICLKTNSDDGFVMHHDLHSRTGHTIPQVQVQALACIALGSAGHLTTISLEPMKQDIGEFRQLRVTNCRLLERGTFTCRTRLSRLPLSMDWVVLVRQDLQTRCRNRMGILHARSAPQRVGLIVPISYHCQTDTICVHTLQEHQVSSPPCMANVDKDILYYVANDEGKQSIRISNPSAGTFHSAAKGMDLGLPRDPSDRVFLFDHGHRVLIGDSRFVAMIDATSTRVWSFGI
ncbi:hypothetical protein BJY01DRAFT_141493 [Aspergillus pseudoustus]|uniref:F-box domain-containing protein n=1 Tax=Aspergillus pseudoustus TaxID=1810923 RepID=A0ABR4IGP6_9EURO